MVRCLFVDLTTSFYDRHPVYYLTPVLRKAGCEVFYIQARSVDSVDEFIQRHKIDTLLYTSFSNYISNYSLLDYELKKRHAHLFSILGGPGVTQREEREMLFAMNTTIDAFCVGEGETALKDFFENGRDLKKNLISSSQLDVDSYHPYVDVNSLDLPDRSVVYKKDQILKDMPVKQFMGGRGCPYKCTYCHNHTINELFKGCGPVIRLKDVDYIINEVRDVIKRYPLDGVVFQDDIFFFNKKWSFEFAEKWASKIGLPWSCNIRPDYINEDLIRALSESNCRSVTWSIESGNEFLRNKVLDRRMTNETVIKCADLLNSYGIAHRTGNIIGIPGEKVANIKETIELNIRSKPTIANAHIFVPFKGLKLTDYALEEKHVNRENLIDIPDTYFEGTILNFSDKEKLIIRKMMLLFPIFVGFPWFYRNNFFYSFLMALNDNFLGILNKLYVGYMTSRLFKVEGNILFKLKMLKRFLSFGT